MTYLIGDPSNKVLDLVNKGGASHSDSMIPLLTTSVVPVKLDMPGPPPKDSIRYKRIKAEYKRRRGKQSHRRRRRSRRCRKRSLK